MGEPKPPSGRIEEKQSITISEEWAELSAVLCPPEFIKSVAHFLKQEGIKRVLECACGDAHVLSGLVEEGLKGVGIDSDDYLINRARKLHQGPNIAVLKGALPQIDQNIPRVMGTFDTVMCRGNSITALGAWGTTPETFDAGKCQKMIEESLLQMWSFVREGGILYLDINKQEDLNKGTHEEAIDLGDVHLLGTITIDEAKKRRDVFGEGTVNGKYFKGGSSSYLITPQELRDLVTRLLNPQKVWTPKEIQDSVYEVICVRK